jgi:hypothetical protein
MPASILWMNMVQHTMWCILFTHHYVTVSPQEISARFVMKELKDRWSYLRRAIKHYPNIREMLAQSSRCAVCEESFLNTWLECVRFVDAHQVSVPAINFVGVNLNSKCFFHFQVIKIIYTYVYIFITNNSNMF